MIINLSPQRRDDAQPIVSVQGDTITINGEAFDFSQIGEGDTLPREAVDSEWIAGPVERKDGQIELTLILPHGYPAPEETKFPQPINAGDGPVQLPPYKEPEPEEENIDGED